MSLRVIRLKELLSKHTAAAAAELTQIEADGKLRCMACAHRCHVPPGRSGVCRIRFNEGGTLRVPWGYVAGLAADPIEKKPFYHAFPGTEALSFGMLGCDLHCSYCQNWITSQSLRDDDAITEPHFIEAQRVVELALQQDCKILTSTYNEPLITAEWAVEIFRLGQSHGMIGSLVSNGNGTPEVLEYLRPYVDLFKIDLKSFRDESYRQLGGSREDMLSTIRLAKQMEFWVELVTLVVPGFNDSDHELAEMADFIAGVSPEIPWHVTRVSSGLPHDRHAADVGGHVDAGVRHRPAGRAEVRLRRKPGRAGRRL